MRPSYNEAGRAARAEAEHLLDAISAAESVIVTTIERECEALRAGRRLAATALHLRLCDAARAYLHAAKSTRASLGAIEEALPGSYDFLEDRRAAFSALLKVELSILAAEREAAGEEPIDYFDNRHRANRPPPERQNRPGAAPPVRLVAARGDGGDPGAPPAMRRGVR
jgi:hypothetical protein